MRIEKEGGREREREKESVKVDNHIHIEFFFLGACDSCLRFGCLRAFLHSFLLLLVMSCDRGVASLSCDRCSILEWVVIGRGEREGVKLRLACRINYQRGEREAEGCGTKKNR